MSNVAFASGGRERLTGAITFPESKVVAQAPDGPFPDQLSGSRQFGRALEYSLPAGDLDGYGSADLFTTSFHFEILTENGGNESALPQIDIHSGTPAPPSTLLR